MRLLREIRNVLGNYHLKSGIYHYYRGEYKRAVSYLGRSLEQDSRPSGVDAEMARYYLTQTYIASAEEHERGGRWGAAELEFRQALQFSPGYADLHHRIGRLLERQGRTAEAVESYRAALGINADFLDARLALAFALLRTGSASEALGEFQRSRELALAAVEEPFVRGREALIAGQAENAAELMREAFLRRPHQFAHHYRLGLAALQKEHYEEAVEELRQACESQSGFPDVHNTLGVALCEAGQQAAGVEEFQRALRCSPDYLVARLNMAYALAEKGQTAQAESEVKAVLQQEPENAAALTLQASLRTRRKTLVGR